MDPGPIFTIYTSSTVTYLLAANHYLPHHTFNPLLPQTGELDNLTNSLGQSLEFVLCRSPVACSTFGVFPSCYWFDNLGFLLRETCLLNCITPSSWGLPTKCCCTHQYAC